MTQIPKVRAIKATTPFFGKLFYLGRYIFFIKKQLSTAQHAVGWVINNEIVCDVRVLCLWV